MSSAESSSKKTATPSARRQKKKDGESHTERKLPDPELEDIRGKVKIGSKAAYNTAAIEDPHAFSAIGIDNSFSLDDFKSNFKVKIMDSSEDRLVVDLVGIGAPLANAFRRILLVEVPTMAIEKVNIYQNTSIIQDEVLAHRLGLIPIKADPRLFKYMAECNQKATEENTIVFTLQISCTANSQVPDTAPLAERYNHATVYSRDLVWEPQGNQAEIFENDPIRPVHDDIIIAKLRPGQTIEAELLCEKGIGQVHAKWSPVATAFYRLMPDISFIEPIEDELAEELVQKCPANVFDIEDLGKGKGKIAKVARPRDCTMCRECIREPGWEERVRLRKIKDHFIFTIESVGMYAPKQLMLEALHILKKKCQALLNELNKKP